MYDFKFVGDNGQIVFVRARNKQEAVEKCSGLTGILKEYIKDHFKIKKVWKVTEDE